jgi:hypothetical protein
MELRDSQRWHFSAEETQLSISVHNWSHEIQGQSLAIGRIEPHQCSAPSAGQLRRVCSHHRCEERQS